MARLKNILFRHGVILLIGLSGCSQQGRERAERDAVIQLVRHCAGLNKAHTRLFIMEDTRCRKTDFGDDDVRAILPAMRSLRLLRAVNLSGTSVTDASIKELAALQKLEDLEVGDANVSVEALQSLAQRGHLRFLLLSKERHDPDALQQLQRAAPDMEIWVTPIDGPMERVSSGPQRYRRDLQP